MTTFPTPQPQKTLRDWFEQNYLDGDAIQNGQMLSSETCFEAILSARKEEYREMIEKLEKQKKFCPTCSQTDLEWGYEGDTECSLCHETLNDKGGVKYNEALSLAITLLTEYMDKE